MQDYTNALKLAQQTNPVGGIVNLIKNMKTELVAPCGMNCRICIAFFGYTITGKKRKMHCIGSNPSGKSCAHLKKYCDKLTKKEIEYCYKCNDFPCKQIQKLDFKYSK